MIVDGLFFSVVHIVSDERARLSPRGKVRVAVYPAPTCTNAPTAKQFAVLALIAEGQRQGLPPTNRQLAASLGVTQNAVCEHLKPLAHRGLIELANGRSRATVITPAGWAALAPAKEVA